MPIIRRSPLPELHRSRQSAEPAWDATCRGSNLCRGRCPCYRLGLLSASSALCGLSPLLIPWRVLHRRHFRSFLPASVAPLAVTAG
jgi:hypothetical protein